MTSFVIAGATGLIGSALAQQLSDPTIGVTLLTRRPTQPAHPHHTVAITDFSNLALPRSTSEQDTVFCALGTTIRKAGSQAAFAAVDLTMVVDLARAAQQAGYANFVVISSLGARTDTRNFYLRTKGQMEKAVRELSFERTTILRPSLLLGHREEFRLGEKLGESLGRVISPLLAGSLKRYRPIQAETVAQAMRLSAERSDNGSVILESDAIEQLASQQ